MRSVWQSLAWKEWHEHKWKLAALSGILCGVTTVSLLALLREDFDSLDGFIPAMVMGMIPLTIFIGMGEAAGENANRTMPFLQSLPVPMWKAAVWKLIFGALSCLVPMLLTLLLVSAWYYFADMLGKHPQTALRWEKLPLLESMRIRSPLGAWIVVALAAGVSISASLLIWTAALGVNRKSEVAAGGVALLGIVGWWVAMIVLGSLAEDRLSIGKFEEQMVAAMALAASPGGFAVVPLGEGLQSPPAVALAFLVAIAAHVFLARQYVLRFGRASSISTYSPQPATRQGTQTEWLGLPRRSPLTAVVWKQLRESGPIALAGLAAIVFFVAVNIVANPDYYAASDRVVNLLFGLTGNIGFLVVLIVGIGVFDRDLSPQLHSFWRSRPIDPNLWFWTKYLTGLVVLACVLLIPVTISGVMSWRSDWYPFWPYYYEVLVTGLCLFLAVYALSVMTICLIRATVYAAILSMGILTGGICLVWLLLDTNNTQWSTTDWTRIVTVLTLIAFVIATLIGWWAVRRDIGWRK